MTALPVIDAELVEDLIYWAEVGESLEKFKGWGSWDQGNWAKAIIRPDSQGGVCGTAYCMAGQAVTQAGYRLDYNNTDDYYIGAEVSVSNCVAQIPVLHEGSDVNARWVDAPGAEPVDIEETAVGVLGLSNYEAGSFFSGSNSLDDLKGYANLFFAARGLPLPYEGVAGDEYDLTTEDGREEADDFYSGFDTYFSWNMMKGTR